MSVIGHDHVYNFADASGLVFSPIYIVHQNWLGELMGRKFCLGDEVLINKVICGASVNHSFDSSFLHCICGFEMNRDHDTVWAFFQ